MKMSLLNWDSATYQWSPKEIREKSLREVKTNVVYVESQTEHVMEHQ